MQARHDPSVPLAAAPAASVRVDAPRVASPRAHDAATALPSPMPFKGPGFVQQYGAFFVRLSRFTDAAIVFAAYYALLALRGDAPDRGDLALALLAVVLFRVVSSFSDLYRSWRAVRLRHEFLALLAYWAVAFGLLLFALLYFPQPGRDAVLMPWFLAAYAGMAGSRVLTRMVLRQYRARGHDRKRVAFAGCTPVAFDLARTFGAHPWMGLDVVGYFDDRAPAAGRALAAPAEAQAGRLGDLVRLARSGEVAAVYICLPMAAERRIKELIDALAHTAVSVHYCPGFFEFGLLNARWDDVFGQPVVSLIDSPFVGPERLVKRVEDVLLSVFLLPALALPMLAAALAVALTSPGPVLFRQLRYGLDGRPFHIFKFRTMVRAERDDEFRQATRGDARVTPVGALLRKYSIDELPQIFNVLRGEMSIVGPRPHPVKLNEEHRDLIHRYMLRHKVKPGITGLAQVNGCRGETREPAQMARRIEYDLQYIRNWSLWLDLRILARTVRVVLTGDNAY